MMKTEPAVERRVHRSWYEWARRKERRERRRMEYDSLAWSVLMIMIEMLVFVLRLFLYDHDRENEVLGFAFTNRSKKAVDTKNVFIS